MEIHSGLVSESLSLVRESLWPNDCRGLFRQISALLDRASVIFLFISTLTFKELNDLSQNANITIVLIIAKTEARNKFLLDII